MLRLNLLSELKSTTSAGKQFHGATIRSAKKCFLTPWLRLTYSLYWVKYLEFSISVNNAQQITVWLFVV